MAVAPPESLAVNRVPENSPQIVLHVWLFPLITYMQKYVQGVGGKLNRAFTMATLVDCFNRTHLVMRAIVRLILTAHRGTANRAICECAGGKSKLVRLSAPAPIRDLR